MFGLLTQASLRKARFAPADEALQSLENLKPADVTPRRAILAINSFFRGSFHSSPMSWKSVNFRS